MWGKLFVQAAIKHNKGIRKLTCVLLAVFLSITNITAFITSSGNLMLIAVTTLFLAIIYYFMIRYAFGKYSQALSWLNQRLLRIHLKYVQKTTPIAWLPSAIVGSVLAIILYAVSNYYILVEISTLGDQIDYGFIVINMVSTYLPRIVIVFVLLGLIMQVLVLRVCEKMAFLPALISSFLTICLFVFVFIFVNYNFTSILASL